MNKSQRKEITNIVSRIEQFKAHVAEVLEELQSDFDDIKSDIECMRDEEQEKYDNMPENMQWGEKGDRQQEIADKLDEACGACDDIDISSLADNLDFDVIVEGIEEARDM